MSAGSERWDVVVVGAGPAGSTAARVAAEDGARVLLLDAARFPRYKTCGGGLIGTSLALLPEEALATVERRVGTASFSRRGGPARRVRSESPFLAMTNREPFDQALVDAAVAAGATFRDHTRVRRLEQLDGEVVVHLADRVVLAAAVVGADGSAGVTARHVGVRVARTDLGLEVELSGVGPEWSERVHIDWGPGRGTYGWVFPKGDRLTVGVIERKGRGPATRAYLEAFVAELGLADRPVLRSSGHLTQWRAAASPVVRGAVLVAGDAAGLLEPWTREGISFALRSGLLAGRAAAAASRSAAGEVPAVLAGYTAAVTGELEPDQRAGALLLALFERFPLLVHLLVTRTGPGARAFVRFCRGTLRLGALFGRSSRPVQSPRMRAIRGE